MDINWLNNPLSRARVVLRIYPRELRPWKKTNLSKYPTIRFKVTLGDNA